MLMPALSSAAAFAMPEPTQLFAIAADNWSPAPTAAPQFSIFGRNALQANEGNTCGYISGLQGTYFSLMSIFRIPPTDVSSVLCNMPQLANLRNKHLFRHSWLLRSVFPLRLHDSNVMHPF